MHPDYTARACTDINQILANRSRGNSECSIYRTHDRLRNVNDKAYEPEIIAIGPYHSDKENTKMMEEHKLLYLHSLLKRKNETVEKYVSAIGEIEWEARKCYAEPIWLSPAMFTKMMILDGCFIIDLVRKCNMEYLRENNDPIFKRDWMMNSLVRDLMLFENQIPFSVLCKLFDLIEQPNHHQRLMNLILCFFSSIFPGAGYKTSVDKSSNEIKHLLELIHISWLPSLDWLDFDKDSNDKTKRWRFVNSATKLRDSNVKFGSKQGATSLFNITFKNGCMLLPPLTIGDGTEPFFRNLIAYEQYFPDPKCSFITDYAKLLGCLIDSPGDVDILCDHGILDNRLSDEEGVSNALRRLTDSVTGSGKHFIYAKIFESVNIHCNIRRNRWMANLKENYFNGPWAIISVIAAFVQLLLTLIQAVCSILQVT